MSTCTTYHILEEDPLLVCMFLFIGNHITLTLTYPYPITPFFVPSIMSLLNVSGELVMSPLDLCHTMYAYWLLHKAVPQVLYMPYSSHYRVLYPKGFLLHTGRTCTQEGILCHMSPIGLLLCIERTGTEESLSYALCATLLDFFVVKVQPNTQKGVQCTMSLHSDGRVHRRRTQERLLEFWVLCVPLGFCYALHIPRTFSCVPVQCTVHSRGTQKDVLCIMPLHTSQKRDTEGCTTQYVFVEHTAERHRRVSYVLCLCTV